MNGVIVEKTQILVLVMALAISVTVFTLIRRRKLNEVYSVTWFGATLVLLALAAFPGVLIRVSELIGALNTNSTLFFSSLVFVMAFLVHASIRFSALRDQNKNLTQELALLRGEVEQDRERIQALEKD